MERKRQKRRMHLWKGCVRALWASCLLWSLVGATQETIAENTAQFRDAFLDPTVSHIRLKQGLTLTDEEWGLIRPTIHRTVTVSPADGVHEEIELDLGDHSDLAFITNSGGLNLKNLRMYQLISFAIGGTSTVHLANQFHAAPQAAIRIQGGTMCLTQGICSALGYDVRNAANSLAALGASLDNFDCSVQPAPEASVTQSFDDCRMPQDFGSALTSGVIHMENTVISCSDECMNGNKLSIPSVELQTGDSRQVVAALTNLILESVHLKIKLLDSLSISSNILSRTITVHVDRHGSMLSIDGLLPDQSLAHMIFNTEGVIFMASTGFTIELSNMVLGMAWLGPGLFSKQSDIFVTCDEDVYVFKWPLFFPYVFSLHGSSLKIANTSLVYKECPSNLDFDEFTASLLAFNETVRARAYDEVVTAEPEIDFEKIGDIGIFFKKLSLELVSLNRDPSTSAIKYTKGTVRVDIENSNVVCESFGRPVVNIPRCSEADDDSTTQQAETDETGMSKSGANSSSLQGASLLTLALVLFHLGIL